MSKREAFLDAACKENVDDFLGFIQLHVSSLFVLRKKSTEAPEISPGYSYVDLMFRALILYTFDITFEFEYAVGLRHITAI